ncbi:MAG: signal peptide peptidase SppA [Pseudomonadota bacterium]
MDSLRIDDLIDRQRLRRKLGIWRLATLIGAIAIVVLLTLLALGPGYFSQTSRNHIAHIKIESAITADTDLLRRLERVKSSSNVRGVIITVDSPGGTTSGGEAIYEAIRRIADEKPTVAQVDGLAASAGYMVSIGSDHVVARKTSIVGSIGVIFQYPNVEGLLDSWGIDMRAIKSTPLKAEPNFYGNPPPGAEQVIREMILDTFDWFKAIVAERRGFDEATITKLADGSVFTGRQALELGLVDDLGGMEVARSWLTEQGVDEDLDIIVYRRENRNSGNFLLRSALEMFGIDAGLEVATRFQERVFLDGLLSIWHVGAD